MEDVKENLIIDFENTRKKIDFFKVGKEGLKFKRYYSKEGVLVKDMVDWSLRKAEIKSSDGTVVFEQGNVEFPTFYDQTAVNIITSKYFAGTIGNEDRETSLHQVLDRIASSISIHGHKAGYYSDEQRKIFYDELYLVMLHQKAAFNSPVWFNCGVKGNRNQFSACFINSVSDSLESIYDLAKIEGKIFKWGSGAGSNFSNIRSKKETISGGGTPSGPVSFMRGYDTFAGVIKSGGKTRRSAKMAILNIDHPDIEEFIESKAIEEGKASVLKQAGYGGSFQQEAQDLVFLQNENHSIAVTDAFMQAVEEDKEWELVGRLDGRVIERVKARDLLGKIAKSCHTSGCPGLIYIDTVNKMNTVASSGPIRGCNPCSEFYFMDDSACNLASLNLKSFLAKDGTVNLEEYVYVSMLMILAQDILCDYAEYPTKAIKENSLNLRPLGLGYTNVHTFLLSLLLPYDSEKARNLMALLTSILTSSAYLMSSFLAEVKGKFNEYDKNEEHLTKVLRGHYKSFLNIKKESLKQEEMLRDQLFYYDFGRNLWVWVLERNQKYGVRNSMVTLVAPAGTISFALGAETTGIEPKPFLQTTKQMVDGGSMKMESPSFYEAFEKLGYNPDEALKVIKETGKLSIEIKGEHKKLFETAYGDNHVSILGHVKMLEACQPFLSGSISKTLSLPCDSTVDDMMQLFIECWKRGVKSVAPYRDGSKLVQPLVGGKVKKENEIKNEPPTIEVLGRNKLPVSRKAINHTFNIGGHKGYFSVGLYDNGQPGELFITMAKQGSTVSGLVDMISLLTSHCLQLGMPIRKLIEIWRGVTFQPLGYTSNQEIKVATSFIDYIARFFEIEFLNGKSIVSNNEVGFKKEALTGNVCPKCSGLTYKEGNCDVCRNCGETSGCV